MRALRCGHPSSSPSIQLVGIGAYVGSADIHGMNAWIFAAATAALGIGVVTLKLVLGH